MSDEELIWGAESIAKILGVLERDLHMLIKPGNTLGPGGKYPNIIRRVGGGDGFLVANRYDLEEYKETNK